MKSACRMEDSMGKLEANKLQKRNSILDTAFNLFTTKGVSKTSIAEISEKAGIAKGTFYLYFKDKYDIRNRLISHESSKLFQAAADDLHSYINKKKAEDSEFEPCFEDQIVFIANHIIDALNNNQTLLTFISKNLSWGIFKEALTTNVAANDINFRDVYYKMIDSAEIELEDPEIMLFLIVELVSSTSYSAILYQEPADINTIKPHLYKTIKAIIKEHTIKNKKSL